MNAPSSDVLFTTRIKIEGTPHHVTLFPAGLTVGLRPGKGRMVGWSEVVTLADGPPVDRYGVVVNNRLLMVLDDENDAYDRAADQRQLGEEAIVIRVPVPLAT